MRRVVVCIFLLTALTAKRLIKEFPEANKSDADLGLDKPAAVLSIWVDGIKKDEATNEKKDEKAKDDKSKDDKKGAGRTPGTSQYLQSVRVRFFPGADNWVALRIPLCTLGSAGR